MRIRVLGLSALAVVWIGGCSDPNTTLTQLDFGTSKLLYGSANLRTISERGRYVPGEGSLSTVCAEPSPDVALAFAKSASVNAKITEATGPSGEGSGSFSTSETVTALAGRTAGVLALRDGLYAACQAYVNGVIGHDGYALILSQYGNLLIALAGTGTASPASYTAQDAAQAALLVTYLSEYDSTRLGGGARNPLLTPGSAERYWQISPADP